MTASTSLKLARTSTAVRHNPRLLSQFDDLLQDFVSKGGPLPPEYAILNRAIRHLADAARAGLVSHSELAAYADHLTRSYLPGTMQAEAWERKYGYSGDFEIIDHIYTRQLCSTPELRRWDLFFHAQAAPVAVRNRKAYFQSLMAQQLAMQDGEPLHLLNVASGPCRDLREFLLEHPDAALSVDCVDMDAHAIAYGKRLCTPWLDKVTFHHGNVLKHTPARSYDLVWSAGLFDYLSDRLFVHLLTSLLKAVKPGGEVIVGNFSDFNPSRDYMEIFGHWHLYHRSRETLISLASRAGASLDQIQIHWEPEGVNYFLHIRR